MEVYSFQKEGRGMARRIDKPIDGKFRTSTNPKDRLTVPDCIDPRERRMLEFVMPILYLEKPSWITLMVGNTIFGALFGFRKVN